MTATTSHGRVGDRLERFRRADGNWRLKGLLLALSDGVSASAVGAAWPRSRPQEPRDYVNLATRHDDTQEYALARELYDTDAIASGEVVPKDEYYSRVLVDGTTEELDVLWRDEIVDTVQRGADIRRMARTAATVTPVDAPKGTVPIEAETPFASASARGAAAEFDEADTYAEDYTVEKWEQGFAIEDELVEHADIDAMEFRMRRAGEGVENAINRQFINEFIDNGTSYDADLSGSGSTDVRDLLMKASEAAADNDFDPTDTVVMHPEYASELFGNNQLAGLDGIRSDTTDQDNAVAGHEPFVQSGTAYTGANTYAFNSDGNLGALVFGRAFAHVVEYRDIEITELQPPFTAIHDLQGGVARAQTDVVAADPDENGTYESVIVVQR